MRIFEQAFTNYSVKTNFVDENGVFVGFDNVQVCCEYYGWFIADHIVDNDDEWLKVEKNKTEYDLEGYIFDKTFTKQFELRDELNEGPNIVVFRLTSPNNKPLYLHLFNCHNGYYAHHFDFVDEYVKLGSGSI